MNDYQQDVKHKAFKAGLWYAVSAFLMKGIAFLTTPLFARFMSVAEIGLFSNLTSWAHILGVVVTLNMEASVSLARFEYGDSIYQYLSSIVLFGSAATAACYALAVRFSETVAGWLGVTDYMLHAMFLYFLFSPAALILNSKCRICLQYWRSILTSLLPSGIAVAVSVATVLVARNGGGDALKARTIGYYGVWVAFSLAVWLYLLLRGRCFRMEHIRFALPLSVPIILHALANNVLGSSDQVMIKRICGPEDAGYYAVAYNCGLIVSVLWGAINQAFSPWCYQMMHEKKYGRIGPAARPIALSFSVLAFLLILLGPEFLYFMGGSAYMSAARAIPPIILGYVAQALYTFYVNIEFFHKKQWQIMIGTVIAALLNIVLNLAFIPRFGYTAAAYTTLTGYVALLLIHYLFVRRMGLHTIYDMRFHAGLMAVMTTLGLAATTLYGSLPVRVSLIFSLSLCALVAFRGHVKKFLERRKERGTR